MARAPRRHSPGAAALLTPLVTPLATPLAARTRGPWLKHIFYDVFQLILYCHTAALPPAWLGCWPRIVKLFYFVMLCCLSAGLTAQPRARPSGCTGRHAAPPSRPLTTARPGPVRRRYSPAAVALLCLAVCSSSATLLDAMLDAMRPDACDMEWLVICSPPDRASTHFITCCHFLGRDG